MIPMMNWGVWGNSGFGIFMWLQQIFWLVILVIGLVLAIKWLQGYTTQAAQPRSDSALEILRSRYARGEITREDFESIKATLLM
ncbi:MAG: SHOCT domain-containing protein [Candidatus Aquicultorales bacterium]